MKFDPMFYGKLGLATVCYAVAFRLVCGGVYWLMEAWVLWRKNRAQEEPPKRTIR